MIQCFRSLPMGAEVLLQMDRLVTLLETPCFTFLRLQLLQPRRHPALLRAMYSMLMLLPQSNAWRTLNTRMQSIPIFALMQLDMPSWGGSSSFGPQGMVRYFEEQSIVPFVVHLILFSKLLSCYPCSKVVAAVNTGGVVMDSEPEGQLVADFPALLEIFIARQQKHVLVEERGAGTAGGTPQPPPQPSSTATAPSQEAPSAPTIAYEAAVMSSSNVANAFGRQASDRRSDEGGEEHASGGEIPTPRPLESRACS